MDRLDEMLLAWEDRRGRGDPVGADVLCPDDTRLQLELAERIRLLEAFDSLVSPPAPPPERFGRYKVRRKLGSGGMGDVYVAWDPKLAKAVAVKVLKTDRVARSGNRAAAKFERERRLLAKFARKSVVAALDAGEDHGIPYLVMDYLPGGSLADHRGRLTAAGPKAIVPLVEKIARAVQDAHGVNVLHRDLKPGNVLLDETGNPFIADFGLATILAPDEPEADGEHATTALPDAVALTTLFGAGTPAYMAPEQYDKAFGPIGKPADVWALGVILYELLAGTRPFIAAPGAPLREQVTRVTPTPLLGVPKALAAVVARCLEKQPAKRFQTAGELADGLRRLQQPTRRQALRVATVGTLALGGGLGGLAFRPKREETPPDPEFDGYTNPDAVRESLAKLERGEAVTLVEKGRPAPAYRFAIGPASGQVFSSETYPFGVQPNGYCLVEFLPRLPRGEWLIEARLEHTVPRAGGRVGVATSISRARSQDSWIAQAYTLSFMVDDEQKPGIAVEVTATPGVLLVREAGPLPFPGADVLIGIPRLVPPEFHSDPPGLRRLEISVSENSITGRVGGAKFPAVDVGRYVAARDDWLTGHPLPPGSSIPVTKFLGGIGVYAKFGVLRVETFTVRPKPPAS